MFIIALSLLTGCGTENGKDKATATVEKIEKPEPAAKPEAKPTVAKGEAWKVDASASSIRVVAAKVIGKHPIDFKTFTGTVTVDGDKVTAVSYEVDMPTLEADDPKLTKHLLTEDFFDVAKFPKSTFTSSAIKAGSDVKGFTHSVTGDFTIMGTKKTLSFPATMTVKDGVATAKTEFVMNRQDFGITYKGMADNLIQDPAVLTVELTAKK